MTLSASPTPWTRAGRRGSKGAVVPAPQQELPARLPTARPEPT
jgi:hypothetical protein